MGLSCITNRERPVALSPTSSVTTIAGIRRSMRTSQSSRSSQRLRTIAISSGSLSLLKLAQVRFKLFRGCLDNLMRHYEQTFERTSDAINTLVSIYDSKDLFVKELQVLLAQRLLAIKDDSMEKWRKRHVGSVFAHIPTIFETCSPS
jgi:hypothetical protein